jgi:hypothetical protein
MKSFATCLVLLFLNAAQALPVCDVDHLIGHYTGDAKSVIRRSDGTHYAIPCKLEFEIASDSPGSIKIPSCSCQELSNPSEGSWYCKIGPMKIDDGQLKIFNAQDYVLENVGQCVGGKLSINFGTRNQDIGKYPGTTLFVGVLDLNQTGSEIKFRTRYILYQDTRITSTAVKQ